MDSTKAALLRLQQIIDNQRTTLNTENGKKEAIEQRKANINQKLSSYQIDILEQCALLFQHVSAFKRENARQTLEELGTMALQYSMGPDYEMKIELGEERKKPTAEAYVVHLPTLLKTSPLDSNGGGVVDILSIAMRVMVLQMFDDPKIDGPIIMDEPFKMASEEYIPLIATFLKKISEDFDRQIIMITHDEYLAEACDTIITVKRNSEQNESSAVNTK